MRFESGEPPVPRLNGQVCRQSVDPSMHKGALDRELLFCDNSLRRPRMAVCTNDDLERAAVQVEIVGVLTELVEPATVVENELAYRG